MSNTSNNFDREKHIFHSPKYKSVVKEALEFFTNTPVHQLPPPERFIGAGVYALYYLGNFNVYLRISEQNRKACVLPIYVGKAVPPGWRTARTHNSGSEDLRSRLNEHVRSIRDAKGIQISDFRCRFIILEEAEGDFCCPC
ncbi:MAG: Eco29kI family restriction endonuclease [Dehalococcoidales bacterium]|nr:Eco29kI family restriction endonuclease [Dehalococcoidales bacterium]